MQDASAIQAIQQAQSLEIANSFLRDQSAHRLTLKHKDHELLDLERYEGLRRRARGSMQTTITESFAQYVHQHQEPGCSIFIDPEEMSANAVLNLGTPAEPGHADNRATLTLRETPAYTTLRSLCKFAESQQKIAEWLEDWQDIITAHVAPETASDEDSIPGQIKIRTAIAAIRSLTIEQAKSVGTTVGNLNASASTFESIAAKSVHTIPTRLCITTPTHEGLEPRAIQVRLGILTGDKAPTISLRIIREGDLQESIAKEFEEKLRDLKELENTPIHIGVYAAAP